MPGQKPPTAQPVPEPVLVYHIMHLRSLPSIIENGGLFCDDIKLSLQRTG